MPTLLEQLEYGFDRDSRRTWRRRAFATGEDNAYGYDGLSQVVNAALGNLNLNATAIGGVPAEDEAWDYDPTGNWRGYRVEENGAVTLEQERVHDKGNRLMQIEGSAQPVLVDRAGRMTQVPPDAGGDWSDPLELVWDAWSRLVEVSQGGSVVGSYAYDGLNRRTTRTTGGATLHSYYSDAWRPLEERQDSQTKAAMQYYWGARHRDDLVRRDRATVSGGSLNETRYVLMDYFSPVAITDGSGNVTERYAFSAFGVRRILNPDFSPHTGPSECNWEFAFQGQFLDSESGFLDYGYRYYSSYLGRWLCKDPIGEEGGLNLYAFAGNGGVNQVDYLGLSTSSDLSFAYQQLQEADSAQNTEDSFTHQQVQMVGQQIQNLGDNPSEDSINRLLRDIGRIYRRTTGTDLPPNPPPPPAPPSIPTVPEEHAMYNCTSDDVDTGDEVGCQYSCTANDDQNAIRRGAMHVIIPPNNATVFIPRGSLYWDAVNVDGCCAKNRIIFLSFPGARVIGVTG